MHHLKAPRMTIYATLLLVAPRSLGLYPSALHCIYVTFPSLSTWFSLTVMCQRRPLLRCALIRPPMHTCSWCSLHAYTTHMAFLPSVCVHTYLVFPLSMCVYPHMVTLPFLCVHTLMALPSHVCPPNHLLQHMPPCPFYK